MHSKVENQPPITSLNHGLAAVLAPVIRHLEKFVQPIGEAMEYPSIIGIVRKEKKGFPAMEKLSLDVADILRNKAQYHPKIVEEVLKGALWWSADYTGKGLKCQFRSETAHNRILRHAIKDIKGQEFVHEHIVPKTLILEELLKLNTGCNLDTLAIDVERLLNLSIYCLIDIQGNSPDKEIDKNGMRQKMPNSAWADINAKPEDIWGRYEKIKVIRLP